MLDLVSFGANAMGVTVAGVSTVITTAEAGDNETGGSMIWPGSTDGCDEYGVGRTRVRIGGQTGEAGVSSRSSMLLKCGAVLLVSNLHSSMYSRLDSYIPHGLTEFQMESR